MTFKINGDTVEVWETSQIHEGLVQTGSFKIEKDEGIPELGLEPTYHWRVTSLHGNSGAGRWS